VMSATGGLRVVRNTNMNDTVSEGIGYGMIASVYMNDKATFDGLWSFAKAHMDANGLMNWHLNADGSVAAMGTGSATDADEDMAWALVMASTQFSSSTYSDDAKRVIGSMFNLIVGPDGTLSPGDSWGSTPRTFPDYFSPAYYRVFAKVTGNKTWSSVIDRNYQILADVSGSYGLVPDSVNVTVSGYANVGDYGYDACRTPWRIAMDYCYNADPRAKAYLDKVGAFFNGKGARSILAGYSVTGTATATYPDFAFIGPAGVSGMAGYPTLLNDAFTYGTGAGAGNGGTSYYSQSLRVVTLLMMSGNFLDYTQL
jgi:endo-1,4-beta-D-glucanase Y